MSEPIKITAKDGTEYTVRASSGFVVLSELWDEEMLIPTESAPSVAAAILAACGDADAELDRLARAAADAWLTIRRHVEIGTRTTKRQQGRDELSAAMDAYESARDAKGASRGK